MFRVCKLALWDDDQDERDWQLRVAKSRKRIQKKRKDDAAVASFFDHVEDPAALRIVELLLDYSMEETHARTCGNADITSTDDLNQVAITRTSKSHETQDKVVSKRNDDVNQSDTFCQGLEQNLKGHELAEPINHSEPTNLLSTIFESDSERTVETGSRALHATFEPSRQASVEYQSNEATKKGVGASSMDSFTGNCMSPTSSKENMDDDDDEEPKSPKIGEKLKNKTPYNVNIIRRSPLHESSKPQLLTTSRQQKSLALNSF